MDDLLIRLLHVARQTASLLEEEDPDPERIEVLLTERGEIFAQLQRAVLEEQVRGRGTQGQILEGVDGAEGEEGEAGEKVLPQPSALEQASPGRTQGAAAGRRRQIVEEIRRLDEKCIPMARRHLVAAEGRWKDARQLRRALIAYGWVDPEFGPRGGFVDVTD